MALATSKVEVKGLSKTFESARRSAPTEVLRDISFEIRDGEILCLLGPSGCGKTTVLSILAGFQQPTQGEVVVNGKRVARPGPDRGVIFQEHGLFPWRTVLENVLFGPQML